MAISDSTLHTDVWEEVRSKLVAAAIAITNSETSDTTTVTIAGSYNDKAPTRPQIIINPLDKSESSFKFGSTSGKQAINVIVDCYASTGLYVDQMSNQVETTLKDNDIDGLDLVAITTDTGFSSPGQAKFPLKSFVFSYDRE